MADKTKYQFFKEENRLTLVIDNPSDKTEELIKTLIGAEVHDMIGLNKVENEEPETPPIPDESSKVMDSETVAEQEVKSSKPEKKNPEEKISKDENTNPNATSKEEIMNFVSSNEAMIAAGAKGTIAKLATFLGKEVVQSIYKKMGYESLNEAVEKDTNHLANELVSYTKQNN